MSDHQSKPKNIEKYTGTFSKQEGGCSIVVNKTINSITNLDALGLYSYLICRPDSWILNPKHLMTHFDCGKDKIYKCLDTLLAIGLLTRNEIRDKGRFVKFHYQIFLETIIAQVEQAPPVPEKPDTDKPDAEKPDAYKTKKVLNKENITTTTQSSSISLEQKLKNLKAVHLPNDKRTDEEFIAQAMHHIENGDKNFVKRQRVNGLFKIIKTGCFETPPTYKTPAQKKTNGYSIDVLYSNYVNQVKSDINHKLLPANTKIMECEEWVSHQGL